jgi:hypothetical protein
MDERRGESATSGKATCVGPHHHDPVGRFAQATAPSNLELDRIAPIVAFAKGSTSAGGAPSW